MFSAIVGFSAMVNPLANYYTKFYFAAGTTLWATTFSFVVLFAPKVYIFCKQWNGKFKLDSQQQTSINSNSYFTSNMFQEKKLDDGEATVYSFSRCAYNMENSGSKKVMDHSGITDDSQSCAPASPLELTMMKDTDLSEQLYSNSPITNFSRSNSISSPEFHRYYESSNVFVEVQEVRISFIYELFSPKL